MIGLILGLIITGLVVGALARLALPGRDPMSLGQTILVGIGGSLLAGLIARALIGHTNGVPFILAVAVSTGIVYAIRRSRGGTLTQPAPRRGLFR